MALDRNFEMEILKAESLPSAADLDRVAEESKIATATGTIIPNIEPQELSEPHLFIPGGKALVIGPGYDTVCAVCGGLKQEAQHSPFQSAATIIPRHHQSAPKQHWADAEIMKAAEEIDNGQFTPPAPTDDEDLFKYGVTQQLATHPRVKDTMAKLEGELDHARHTQEYLEKAQMIHEYNERTQAGDKWDGQGRWIGKENEEMRKGEVLSPFQFMARLEQYGYASRVEMGPLAVLGRAAVYAYKLDLLTAKQEKYLVGTLQYPLGTEWMIMRFNEYGVPTTAKFLGWRTCLLSMIRMGILTEKEAHRAFPLKEGPASMWYREQLYILRNRGKIKA